jgi:hypothetical protein
VTIRIVLGNDYRNTIDLKGSISREAAVENKGAAHIEKRTIMIGREIEISPGPCPASSSSRRLLMTEEV